MRMTEKLWIDIEETITFSINQKIKNDNLLQKVFKENIPTINFTIYKKDEINAYVTKIEEDKFEIGISKKFILLLWDYSYEVFEKHNLFSKITFNERLLEDARTSLFYLWMEQICLHEFAHLIRRHLTFMKVNKFKEFSHNGNKIYNDSEIKFFEMDADRYSGKLFAGIFGAILINMCKHFNMSHKELIELFLIDGGLYLFHFLYSVDKSVEDVYYITHPHPKQRMIFFITGIQEAKNQKNEILDMDLKELEYLAMRKNIEFIEKNYPDESTDVYEEAKILFEQYNRFLKEKELWE